ncbi:hypothetical protein [Brevundimonas sp. DWP1b2]|uniref:hypothetical protein n=1 Tax=Brevundimonas sp. DWP1b2 TaxID=2804659 RepID=UPI003CF6CD14
MGETFSISEALVAPGIAAASRWVRLRQEMTLLNALFASAVRQLPDGAPQDAPERMR